MFKYPIILEDHWGYHHLVFRDGLPEFFEKMKGLANIEAILREQAGYDPNGKAFEDFLQMTTECFEKADQTKAIPDIEVFLSLWLSENDFTEENVRLTQEVKIYGSGN